MPSPDQPRWLSTAETAAALGVTPKALRLYEAKGLVRPLRTEAGWRAYGSDALACLHQIIALKRLGLSLARIGELLRGRLGDLDAVLAVQEQALVLRRTEAEQALALLRAARARLAAGGTLSLDDLTTLTRETTMNKPMTDDEWSQVFDPHARKHFTPEEMEAMGARKRQMAEAGGWDQAGFQRAWDDLIADAKRLHDPAGPNRGDPNTPAAMELAARWMGMVEQFTQRDPEVTAKTAAVWRDALADPGAAAKLPFSQELMRFVGEADAARLKSTDSGA